MISNQLAAIIKRAAQLREDSYDKAGAIEAQEQLGSGERTVVDFSEFYGLSMAEAADKACFEYNEPDLAPLINAMLVGIWSDALSWADSIK